MLRWLLAASMAYLGLAKVVAGPPGSGPSWWPVAWWLATGAELLAAACLVGRPWRLGAALATTIGMAGVLLVSAGPAMGVSLDRCGCFGPHKASVGAHLSLAVAWLVAGLVVLREAVVRRDRTSVPT
ncbi:MAG: hypothetical protein ACK58X_18820 [Planctomycetota bacterium]|jgi:uncharacterized membrane protein YdcZ (DUF606 family)